MNLTTILAALGMGDGLGNTSNTRVNLTLVTIVWLTPKFLAAVHGEPVTWTQMDLAILATVLGGGIGKTIAEAKADQTTTTTKVN